MRMWPETLIEVLTNQNTALTNSPPITGHTVRSVQESFHQSKDAGFKVVTHMMPDLPNVDLERDILQFIELFENPLFRPDGLKLYPTLVIRGTGLNQSEELRTDQSEHF